MVYDLLFGLWLRYSDFPEMLNTLPCSDESFISSVLQDLTYDCGDPVILIALCQTA